MDQVDIYTTTDGDVVAIDKVVLYTNLGTNSRHLVPPGATLVDLEGKKNINIPCGSRFELRTLDILEERVGVPFEDYQAALSEVRPVQEMRIEQIKAINGWYSGELPFTLNPTPEEEAEQKKKKAELKAECERRMAELPPAPSLLDVIHS